MRFLRTSILVALVLLAGAAIGFAQTDNHDITIDIAGVAALALNDGSTITLSTSAGTPGDPVTGDTDATKRLYYTLLTSSAQTITAQVDALPPAGTSISVVASGVSGNEGTPVVGGITLAVAPANIVNAVTSCATGTGGSDGAALTYTLNITDQESLVIGSSTITVTYTLTGP
jgi:hypothetical protein